MLSYLAVIAVSAPCGALWGAWLGWSARGRLLQRLATERATLEAIRELENRRVGIESGRDALVRAKAGRAARVNEGMGSKPGTLARYLRDTLPTKKNAP